MFEFFRNLFAKISNKNKPDTKKVTFDESGNVVNYKTDNPKDGTPEAVKETVKDVLDKLNPRK